MLFRGQLSGDTGERLPLVLRQVQLQLRRPRRAVGSGQRSRAPGGPSARTPVDSEERRAQPITGWDEDHPVMRQDRKRGQDRRFLPSAYRGRGGEDGSWLSAEGPGGPEPSRGVEKGLNLFFFF